MLDDLVPPPPRRRASVRRARRGGRSTTRAVGISSSPFPSATLAARRSLSSGALGTRIRPFVSDMGNMAEGGIYTFSASTHRALAASNPARARLVRSNRLAFIDSVMAAPSSWFNSDCSITVTSWSSRKSAAVANPAMPPPQMMTWSRGVEEVGGGSVGCSGKAILLIFVFFLLIPFASFSLSLFTDVAWFGR